MLEENNLGYIEQRRINYPISWSSYEIHSWADLMGTNSLIGG